MRGCAVTNTEAILYTIVALALWQAWETRHGRGR
jgi:hypothetical protein